jgi:hypothetical protein
MAASAKANNNANIASLNTTVFIAALLIGCPAAHRLSLHNIRRILSCQGIPGFIMSDAQDHARIFACGGTQKKQGTPRRHALID